MEALPDEKMPRLADALSAKLIILLVSSILRISCRVDSTDHLAVSLSRSNFRGWKHDDTRTVGLG